MLASEQASLVQLFKETAAANRREARWTEDQIVLGEERERQDVRDRKEREAIREAIVAATTEQVEAFRERLDRYDTATVHALMENERQLDEARKRQDELVAKAYDLPDGRKVFKTKDGTRLLDRSGQEVEGVDPQSVPDTYTNWEDFKSSDDQKRALEHDRGDLLAFQARLDHAHEKLDRDGTATNLDALGADLESVMPASVRQEIGTEAKTPEALQPVTSNPVQFKSGPGLN